MGDGLQLAVFKALFGLTLGSMKGTAWLDRTFRFRMPFPRDPEDLRKRQSWCTDALRAGGAIPEGAEVTGFEVQDFKTGEAFRSRVARVRVSVTEGGQEGHVEVLAKFAPSAESIRDHAVFILQDNHSKEAGVYARLSSDPAVSAPRAYAAESHKKTGNLCVLMELMDGAREIPESLGCPPELLDMVTDAFARQHAAFWGGADPRADFLSVVPDVVIDYFATLFTGEDRDLFGALLRVVWRHDARPPVTVLHGDARVGNMFFPGPDGRGRFVLIDWQAARKGKGVFDLAYFLVLSVEPDVRRAHADRLLDLYHARLGEHGVEGYSKEDLLEDYRYACLLVLAFVSLPFMSAESSATDANAKKLRELGDAWARRMMALVDDLDMGWVASRSGLDPTALRAAFVRSNARARAQFPPTA